MANYTMISIFDPIGCRKHFFWPVTIDSQFLLTFLRSLGSIDALLKDFLIPPFFIQSLIYTLEWTPYLYKTSSTFLIENVFPKNHFFVKLKLTAKNIHSETICILCSDWGIFWPTKSTPWNCNTTLGIWLHKDMNQIIQVRYFHPCRLTLNRPRGGGINTRPV